eukprot:7484863-Ditylum_brightwellii.AAC.1
MDPLIKIIDDNFVPFKFVNTYSSGSQTVQWCIIQTSKINIEHILLACGSYVSGNDNRCFPSLSSSTLIEEHGKVKTNNRDHMALKCTVPFPYYIPGIAEEKEIKKLEK